MITFGKLGQYGRLGNQMFQIAGVIGLAIKFGYEYGFPKWVNIDHQDRFASKEDCDVQKYFKNRLPPQIPQRYRDVHIQWGYHDVQIRDNVNIHGHLQSEKYFAHCKSTIKYYFEMHPLIDFKPNENSIALHIRLGDYDDAYHPRLHMGNYYRKALSLFDKGETVYVFSDDISEAKKILNNNSFEYVEGNSYMEDFYMMGLCKHFIIGNSTFSWWPAWLNVSDGLVIAPIHWFGVVAGISSKDLYADKWKIV